MSEKTITCVECGREFVAEIVRGSRTRYCPSCARARRKSQQKERKRREVKEVSSLCEDISTYAWGYPSQDEVRRAKTKPRGMSDIAWRIELRRRANPDYYDKFGEAP